MKVLKVILIIIVVLIAIFFIGGIFLPKTYNVSRSAIINAPDSTLSNYCSDYTLFKEWNPWYKMEPSAKIEIAGEPSQPGHKYTWKGEETGSGEMLITDVNPSKSVSSKLIFIEPFAGEADNQFTFQPAEGGTQVVWMITGENKTNADKWMAIPMDYFLGQQFDDGLKTLKDLVEKK